MELHPSEQCVRVGKGQLQEADLPVPQSRPSPAPPDSNGLVLDPAGAQDAAFDEAAKQGASKASKADRAERKARKKAKKDAKAAKRARRKHTKHDMAGSSSDDSEQPGQAPAAPGPSEQPWLAPHIAVRIVDKHLKGGRCSTSLLYWGTAACFDMVPGSTCPLCCSASFCSS